MKWGGTRREDEASERDIQTWTATWRRQENNHAPCQRCPHSRLSLLQRHQHPCACPCTSDRSPVHVVWFQLVGDVPKRRIRLVHRWQYKLRNWSDQSLELVPDVLIFIQAYWIRHLDINHNALMARIDAGSAEFREELQTLRAHIVSLAVDVANSSQLPAPAPPSSDLTVAIGDLIRSNNDTVAAIGALRAENQQLRDSVLATDAHLYPDGTCPGQC